MIGRRFHNIWLGCEKLLGLSRIVLTALAGMVRVSDVTGYEWRFLRVGQGFKAVVTDSHFWVPFAVLLAGIALLVVLH